MQIAGGRGDLYRLGWFGRWGFKAVRVDPSGRGFFFKMMSLCVECGREELPRRETFVIAGSLMAGQVWDGNNFFVVASPQNAFGSSFFGHPPDP